MATLPQIRGMLLEEALLYLLRVSGYNTVSTSKGDPTIKSGKSGLELKGRGVDHQIDAIADFQLSPPFSHPHRLLVEAKFLTGAVGLPVIRNAVGVLKDVCEYWVPPGTKSSQAVCRYHYQYALFSASGYSSAAANYAFAHDIYLIPVGNSIYFKPVIDAIRNLDKTDFGATDEAYIEVDLQLLRQRVRECLNASDPHCQLPGLPERAGTKITRIINATTPIDGAFLAMIEKRFPVLLVPSPELREAGFYTLREVHTVRIRYDTQEPRNWYLYSSPSQDSSIGEMRLFSFEIPLEIFKIYAAGNMLTPENAFYMKQRIFSRIQAFYRDGNDVNVIHFAVDKEWLKEVRRVLKRIPEEPESSEVDLA